MRLLPAHTREAKDLAKRLKKALEAFGLQRSCRDPDGPPATLQQTQDLLARTLGFEGGWAEMLVEVKKPHAAVYLDALPAVERHTQTEALVTRLSELLGFNYAHGCVWNAWLSAGIGLRPQVRRQVDEDMSPWGLILCEEEIVPGVRLVETGGHGGYVLSEERQQRVPAHLRLADPYYEEDCDWALVVLAFPDEFPDAVNGALDSVNVFKSSSLPRERHNPEGEAFLARTLSNYVPPEQDPMNRPITAEEQKVLCYLLKCVHANQRPIRAPSDKFPALQAWVEVLAATPDVDGDWPMLDGPWRTHWSLGYQMDQQMREWEESWEKMKETIYLDDPWTPMGTDDNESGPADMEE